jgi:hypothetical protein
VCPLARVALGVSAIPSQQVLRAAAFASMRLPPQMPKRPPLDAAIALSAVLGRHWRGASEADRSP